MAWQQNKPEATDQLSQSQTDLQGNFQALDTWIQVDHALPGSANSGKHNKVSFPVQSPAPTFVAGQYGLYNFLDPITTTNQLYITYPDGSFVPMTAAGLSTNPGWTYLPSGILVKWGGASPTGEQTVNYPVAATVPVFTAVYHAQVTTLKNSTASNSIVSLKSFTTTSITLVATQQTALSGASGSCNYIVFGI